MSARHLIVPLLVAVVLACVPKPEVAFWQSRRVDHDDPSVVMELSCADGARRVPVVTSLSFGRCGRGFALELKSDTVIQCSGTFDVKGGFTTLSGECDQGWRIEGTTVWSAYPYVEALLLDLVVTVPTGEGCPGQISGPVFPDDAGRCPPTFVPFGGRDGG